MFNPNRGMLFSISLLVLQVLPTQPHSSGKSSTQQVRATEVRQVSIPDPRQLATAVASATAVAKASPAPAA